MDNFRYTGVHVGRYSLPASCISKILKILIRTVLFSFNRLGIPSAVYKVKFGFVLKEKFSFDEEPFDDYNVTAIVISV